MLTNQQNTKGSKLLLMTLVTYVLAQFLLQQGTVFTDKIAALFQRWGLELLFEASVWWAFWLAPFRSENTGLRYKRKTFNLDLSA